MSSRNLLFPMGKGLPALKEDNVMVFVMWEPRRLTALWDGLSLEVTWIVLNIWRFKAGTVPRNSFPFIPLVKEATSGILLNDHC
jgi:hypothetical protein